MFFLEHSVVYFYAFGIKFADEILNKLYSVNAALSPCCCFCIGGSELVHKSSCASYPYSSQEKQHL